MLKVNLGSANNIKPTTTVVNTKPANNSLIDTNFTFIDTRTTQVGELFPFGLVWCITYPVAATFPGVRP